MKLTRRTFLIGPAILGAASALPALSALAKAAPGRSHSMTIAEMPPHLIPSGTLMHFRQPTAPRGWTKIEIVQENPSIIGARKD